MYRYDAGDVYYVRGSMLDEAIFSTGSNGERKVDIRALYASMLVEKIACFYNGLPSHKWYGQGGSKYVEFYIASGRILSELPDNGKYGLHTLVFVSQAEDSAAVLSFVTDNQYMYQEDPHMGGVVVRTAPGLSNKLSIWSKGADNEWTVERSMYKGIRFER